jgi:queuine tRNA-ribosyltransferase
MVVQSHDICVFENGLASLRDRALGEAMHSSIGPWQEAMQIYVEPSRLTELLKKEHLPPLVIYDVGLGIAANALASLFIQEECNGLRPLHIVSFENDVGGLRLALEQGPEVFPFFGGFEPALRALLDRGQWVSPDHGTRWQLCAGDFREVDLRKLPRPDLIYFDFYSPRVCPELWAASVFRKLHEVCHPWTSLYTYSAATAVRSALLLAGFYVGQGTSTALKLETTLAARELSIVPQPLGPEWLEKLARSDRKLPPDAREEDLERIRVAPQFRR